jgi:hypothetical protein
VNEWNDQHSKRQALSCLTFARHDGKYDVDGVFNRIKSNRVLLFQPFLMSNKNIRITRRLQIVLSHLRVLHYYEMQQCIPLICYLLELALLIGGTIPTIGAISLSIQTALVAQPRVGLRMKVTLLRLVKAAPRILVSTRVLQQQHNN